MKRYDYNFTTTEGVETISAKGKGLKKAVKEFGKPFVSVQYVNKNNKCLVHWAVNNGS
tara:strand:- start:1226 stop:1399 length:174 start_codon:yes stop_codon:yes gene_type:complete